MVNGSEHNRGKKIDAKHRRQLRLAKKKGPRREKRISHEDLVLSINAGLSDALQTQSGGIVKAAQRTRRSNPAAPIAASGKAKRKMLKSLRRAQAAGMFPDMPTPMTATTRTPRLTEAEQSAAAMADAGAELAAAMEGAVRVGGGTVLGAPPSL